MRSLTDNSGSKRNPESRPGDAGRRQAGFSLVDVMVGMVLGLIGTIIIFQVFEASERVKRTTVGGGDAQQNGAAALFALERGVRQARYGYNASDVAATPPLVPLVVTANAANTPDSLTIMYRPSVAAECPPAAIQPAAATNCPWEYGPFSSTSNQVFAPPPGLTTVYYCINNKAQLVSRFTPCVAAPDPANDTLLAEGIAQLKAVPVPDATGTTVALQMTVVARNSNPEKPDPTQPILPSGCNTTVISPASPLGQMNLSGNVGLGVGDDWTCFRYKTFNVTVPLRNVLWQ